MSALTNKTILLISPQSWGNMFISKHHYAVALAKRGNEVYFLNPPDNDHWRLAPASKRIKIEQSNVDPNLHLVNHQLYFPYLFKFHAKSLYDLLMKKQVKDILFMIGKKIDIVWSFDLGNLYPFPLFDKKSFKIFHPVDESSDEIAIRAARGADIIFSVTKEILDKYKHLPVPRYFINHGLAEEFLLHSSNMAARSNGKINVGMSGNLLRTDLDRDILIQIIRENPDAFFHFYGSYVPAQSNIGGGEDKQTDVFIKNLRAFPNVSLHGTLKAVDLAKAMHQMDALLICYDIKKDQSKGTNYHKLMEYLSAGKVIVANNVTTYEDKPEFVRMAKSREDNHELPALFKETIDKLDIYNSPAMQQKRIDYAKQNTYAHQLDKIGELLGDLIDRVENN